METKHKCRDGQRVKRIWKVFFSTEKSFSFFEMSIFIRTIINLIQDEDNFSNNGCLHVNHRRGFL